MKNGIDFYTTDKQFLVRLGNDLCKKFNGIHKHASQLFSRDKQTSKNIYRLNILFKVLDLKKGEIIQVGEDKIKILGFGKRIQGTIVGKKKKVFVDENKINKLT